MPQPNLSHLSVFAAIARHGSFQKGAAATGISTSAASHAIRGLEDQLGISLFHRTTRSVALTEAGQRLLDRLQPVLRHIGDALDEMNGFRATPSGTLRLNCSHVAANLVLAPLMRRFLDAYPHIHLEVAAEDELVDVVEAGFDAGIRLEERVPEDMVGVRIGGRQRLSVVGSPDYLERYGTPAHPADLEGHECLRFRLPAGRICKWEFEKDGVLLNLDVKGRATLGNMEMLLHAACDGLGLAMIFDGQADHLLAGGALVRVLDDWCPSFPGFMIYYPKQRTMPSALRAFIDMIQRRGA